MRLIDWHRVTINLRANYAPLARVAREVGSDEKHMNRLARSEVNEPKFSVGVRLLDLHFDVMGDRHVEASLSSQRGFYG
jgi:hypothetical protein